MELIPLFLLVGLGSGRWRRVGAAVALVLSCSFWLALRVITDGDLYGDGAIGGGFWWFAAGLSAAAIMAGNWVAQQWRRQRKSH